MIPLRQSSYPSSSRVAVQTTIFKALCSLKRDLGYCYCFILELDFLFIVLLENISNCCLLYKIKDNIKRVKPFLDKVMKESKEDASFIHRINNSNIKEQRVVNHISSSENVTVSPWFDPIQKFPNNQ